MSTTTHTPGPWLCPGKDGDDFIVCCLDKTGKRRTIAHAYTEANARLIAASPTLYYFVANLAKTGDVAAKEMLDLLKLSY